MKKKLLASLLALCLVFSLLPVGVLADDVTYEITGGYANDIDNIRAATNLAANNVREQTMWVKLNPAPANGTHFWMTVTSSDGTKTVGCAFDGDESATPPNCFSFSFKNKDQMELWPAGLAEGKDAFLGNCTVKVYKASADVWTDTSISESHKFTADPAVDSNGSLTYTLLDTLSVNVTAKDTSVSNVKAALIKDKTTFEGIATAVGNDSITAASLGGWDTLRAENVVIADTDFPWVVVSYSRAKGGSVKFILERETATDTWTEVGEPATASPAAANAKAWVAIPLAGFTNADNVTSEGFLAGYGDIVAGNYRVGVKLGDEDTVYSEAVAITAEPTRTITVPTLEHGTIAVTAPSALTGVNKGQTVTFTVTPDANYTVVPGSVSYTFLGQTVTLTEADGAYTFCMPGADVTLNASFASVPLYMIHFNMNGNELDQSDGTATVTGLTGGSEYGPGSYAEGATVTFTVKPTDGNLVKSVTAVDADEGAVTLTDLGDGTYTFTMPANAVNFVIETIEAPDLDDATFETAPAQTAGDMSGLGSEEKTAVETALGNSTAIVADADAAQAIFEENNAAMVELAGALDDAAATDDEVTVVVYPLVTYSEYTAPAEDAPGELSVDISLMYRIDVTDENGVTTEGTPAELTTSADVDVTIGLPTGFVTKTDDEYPDVYVTHHTDVYTVTPTEADGKVTVTITAHGLSPFVVSTVNPADAQTGGKDYTTLAAAIAAVANNGTIKLLNDVALDEDITIGRAVVFTIDENGKTFTPGEHIKVAEGYTLTVDGHKYTVAAITTPPSGGGGGGGGGGASATVSVPSASGGKVSVSDSSAKKGDIVTITTTPNAGKVVDTVTVTDAKGNKIAVTDAGNGKYTFVMPDGKVTVKVTFTNAPASGFVDVPANAYYADAVVWAVEKGITNGMGANSFAPNASCTRAQMVTFLWRLAGSPKAYGSNPFADVSSSSYYYDAVMWAVANGITNGTGYDSFSPDDTVTRAQSVTFLYRYAGSPAASGASFGDVAANAYYANAVAWAAANDITNGTGNNTFSPANDCTRAQIVTFMYRYAA